MDRNLAGILSIAPEFLDSSQNQWRSGKYWLRRQQQSQEGLQLKILMPKLVGKVPIEQLHFLMGRRGGGHKKGFFFFQVGGQINAWDEGVEERKFNSKRRKLVVYPNKKWEEGEERKGTKER